MTDEPTDGDAMLRDLAANKAQNRRDTLHNILHATNKKPTATHIARRALVERLRAEWLDTLNSDERKTK
jgi:hypothetical protein